MAHKIADRVRETSTTTGTGTYTLAGAVTGFQAMSAVLTSNADTGFFFVTNGTDWEVLLGTRASSSTLSRTTIYASSNAGSAVSWSAGSKDVVGDIPARFCDLLNTIPITVASAGTTDIGAVHGSQIEISGTTTITSLGTTANKIRFVRFSGVLTLTHNASSLILPGAANITTVAGDTAVFISDASGNWRCWSYTPTLAPLLEGSFTPGFSFGGGTTGITYSAQLGRYSKIGNRVFFHLRVTLTSKGSSSGTWLVTGLPVAVNGSITSAFAVYASAIDLTAGNNFYAVGNVGATTITVYATSNASGAVPSTLSETNASNTTDLIISGHYLI